MIDFRKNNLTENTFSNAMRSLLRNNITTPDMLENLTDNDISMLRGVGVKGKKDILKLRKLNKYEDIFEIFRVLEIKPNAALSFFNKNNINSLNILSTKLHELDKKTPLKPYTITAYLEFKNKVFRDKYNNTLPNNNMQSGSEIIDVLSEYTLNPIKKIYPEEQLMASKLKLEEYIKEIEFTNIDLEKYGEVISRQLDFEYIVGKEFNFDKESLYNVLLMENKEISLFKLKNKLKSANIFDMSFIDDYLLELASDGFIEYTQHGIRAQKPTVVKYIENYSDELYPCTYLRIQNLTLEEIGEIKEVTRERIRQLLKMEFESLPIDKFYESNFIKQYQVAELTQEEFCSVFQFSEKQYSFLKSFYNTERKLLSKNDLLDSSLLDNEQKERLLQVINKNYLVIDSHRIQKNKSSLIKHAVSLFAKEEIHISKFKDLLEQYCKENNISSHFEFNDLRSLEGIVTRLDNVLQTGKRNIRYYGIDESTIKKTLDKINFNRYLNQEISAKAILNDYEDLFYDIEIFNEYELHNLLKRYENMIPENVILARMPLIEVGKANREEQVLNLLIEHSPISRDEYAKKYSEKFGVLIETVKANHMNFLKEFEVDGKYTADAPITSKEILENLKLILEKDFYFKEDIYNTYNEKYGEDELQDYMFPRVGYNNFAQFVLRSKYNRADYYFEEKYFSKDIFSLTDNRINYLGSFRNRLTDLRENFDIFEFSKNEFISFNLINEKTGIEKTEIKKLISEILNQVGYKFFTIQNIEPLIERSKLYQLGFEDLFYESLLKGVSSLRFHHIGGTTVFKKTSTKFYFQDLILETVTRFKEIEIYDLIYYLDENFGIKATKHSILQAIENTGLYYHPIMDMIFQDIEQFYELMEEN